MTDPDLQGRRFLVTGANSGIGRALVERLAAAGADVTLAGRSESRTVPVVDLLRKRHPGRQLDFLPVDLADFGSVRRAADQVLADGRPLDTLVNNAGVAGIRGQNADGIGLTYAVNHLGPFLLTQLLLPRLRESPAGRIVNVASGAHYQVRRLDWSVLQPRPVGERGTLRDYAVTKLMNVLHAKELSRRLPRGSMLACSLHPGVVASNIWRRLPGPLQWLAKRFMLTNEQGAETPFYCATADNLESGAYYTRLRAVTPNPLADDPALAAELWTRSEAAVKA